MILIVDILILVSIELSHKGCVYTVHLFHRLSRITRSTRSYQRHSAYNTSRSASRHTADLNGDKVDVPVSHDRKIISKISMEKRLAINWTSPDAFEYSDLFLEKLGRRRRFGLVRWGRNLKGIRKISLAIALRGNIIRAMKGFFYRKDRSGVREREFVPRITFLTFDDISESLKGSKAHSRAIFRRALFLKASSRRLTQHYTWKRNRKRKRENICYTPSIFYIRCGISRHRVTTAGIYSEPFRTRFRASASPRSSIDFEYSIVVYRLPIARFHVFT